MLRGIINFTFLFLYFLSFSQEKDTLLIKRLNEYRTATNDSIKIHSTLDLGEYILKRDYVKARFYINQAHKILDKSPNKLGYLRSYANTLDGYIYTDRGEYDKAMEYFLKALKYG